ncbi:rhamnulokinase family protein [Paenibacillus thalictri]|uniref:rhamnulokinase n=1 Tax=Paenibacillus thalictri TaxID=2527873 RepID=UPI0026CB2971
MSRTTVALSFDLGASSGRAVVGKLTEKPGGGLPELTVDEVHRFPNDPVRVGGRLYWDILRLFHEIKTGISRAALSGYRDIGSLGIDSWAVDFGLIGPDGELLGNPYHYRNPEWDGSMEAVSGELGKNTIFASTGIQFLPFNTIYQLAALKKRDSLALKQADHLLMIPDLLRYFLTGRRHSEWTNASTTQLASAEQKTWDSDLLRKLGLSEAMFLTPVQPGTMVGELTEDIAAELSVGPIPVVAVAEHDTASAVIAVPAEGGDFAYLSCGTWSLLGTELDRPVLGKQALDWNFTNEGGAYGTYRLLKNIMGLWLVQECKRAFDKAGNAKSFAGLVDEAAEAEPFRSLIDPDDDAFLHPANMPDAIRSYCAAAGQPVPETDCQLIRCILESLALKYRLVLERTEALAGKTFGGLHLVGGGMHNRLLCQFTADAINRPVWAGPAEGSALGNLIVQFIALGVIADVQEGRRILRQSFPPETYTPAQPDIWETAYSRFCAAFGYSQEV